MARTTGTMTTKATTRVGLTRTPKATTTVTRRSPRMTTSSGGRGSAETPTTVFGGIVAASVRFRLLVLGIAAGLMILGATQLEEARVDILPEFTPPYVEVQTEALGLSAEEVEQLVTVPLEADLLNGVAFLEEIRSESIPGLSSI